MPTAATGSSPGCPPASTSSSRTSATSWVAPRAGSLDPKASPSAGSAARMLLGVDGAAGVLEARHALAGAAGDDLGADRHRRLLWGTGADVEPDRRHQPLQSGLVDTRLP